MRNWQVAGRIGVVLALWLVVGPPSGAFAQPPSSAIPPDAMARVKGFYASAEFEEALRLLETLKGTAANPEGTAYQVYCLVALDRHDEARLVVEQIVRADPFFRPADGHVAPRIRTFFDDARKPVLPRVAHESYGRAKAAFDKKDMAPAVSEFDRVIAVLDEIGGADTGLADLRRLAVAFRDLGRTALAPTPILVRDPAAASANPLTAFLNVTATFSAEPAVYGSQHPIVTAPVSISRHLPVWRPSFFELNKTFSGEIAVVINEDGTVLSASMVTGVHPRYDGPLLDAAKSWTFKPATRDGVPVKYRLVIPIRILR